jgi:hypothetical protein
MDKKIVNVSDEYDGLKNRMLESEITVDDLALAAKIIDLLGGSNVSDWVKIIANANPANIAKANEEALEDYLSEEGG